MAVCALRGADPVGTNYYQVPTACFFLVALPSSGLREWRSTFLLPRSPIHPIVLQCQTSLDASAEQALSLASSATPQLHKVRCCTAQADLIRSSPPLFCRPALPSTPSVISRLSLFLGHQKRRNMPVPRNAHNPALVAAEDEHCIPRQLAGEY